MQEIRDGWSKSRSKEGFLMVNKSPHTYDTWHRRHCEHLLLHEREHRLLLHFQQPIEYCILASDIFQRVHWNEVHKVEPIISFVPSIKRWISNPWPMRSAGSSAELDATWRLRENRKLPFNGVNPDTVRWKMTWIKSEKDRVIHETISKTGRDRCETVDNRSSDRLLRFVDVSGLAKRIVEGPHCATAMKEFAGVMQVAMDKFLVPTVLSPR